MLNLFQLSRATCLAIAMAMAVPFAGEAQTDEGANKSILGNWGATYIDGWEGAAPRGVRINFKPDGLMNGFNGCNIFHGKYSFDGVTIKFPHGLGIMTRKYCGPPAGTLARKFSDALKNEMKVVFKPGHLVLLDTEGKARLRLTAR